MMNFSITRVTQLLFKTGLSMGVRVINKSGGSIATDKLVAISGYDATSGRPKIVLADPTNPAHKDVYVTTGAIADGAESFVYKGARSAANLNTNSASAAGDPVYLGSAAGAFQHTAPTSTSVIPVGFVKVKSATVGQIEWFISLGPNNIEEFEFATIVVPAGAAAADYDCCFFTADRAYQIVGVKERHQTAGTDAGTVTLMVKKVPSGTAKASGTDVLSAGINMKATADTVQSGSLHGTVGNLQLAAGDSLALVTTGTLTALDGVGVTVILKKI